MYPYVAHQVAGRKVKAIRRDHDTLDAVARFIDVWFVGVVLLFAERAEARVRVDKLQQFLQETGQPLTDLLASDQRLYVLLHSEKF